MAGVLDRETLGRRRVLADDLRMLGETNDHS
jgi:hypothetical protein